MKTIKVYEFDVIFTSQEEGGFTAEVPDLPGCITEGKTLKEAEANVEEAIELYLETLEERGIPLPIRDPVKVMKMTIRVHRANPQSKAHA